MSRFPAVSGDPVALMVDVGRWVVIASLGISLFFSGSQPVAPSRPVSSDQPWIESPRPESKIDAGKIPFQGTGPAGSKVEIVENGRIIAEAWTGADRKWKAVGKVLGTGKSPILVRVIGGKQSPAWMYDIKGQAKRTLFITNPKEDDDIGTGSLTVSGKGTPGDEILLAYGGKAIARIKVGSSGMWAKEIRVFAQEESFFKAYSQTEGEIVVVFVTGAG